MTVVEPRVVDAGRGFAWWREGWRIFIASPGIWIVVIILYSILSVLVSVVPYVGAVGQSLLMPVFMGGFMVGCRALDRGERLRVSHLFEGFQGPRFVPLMIIGAVNIGLVIVVVLLSGAGVFGALGLGDLATLSNPMDPLAAPLRAFTGAGVLVFVLVLLMAAVFAMLNWFAPALVTLRGVPAIQAMKLSFIACLRNWVPFLLYGLVVIVAGIVVTVGFVALAFAFGAGAFMSGSLESGFGALVGFFVLVFATTVLLAVIVGPIAIGSIYAGFKETLDDGNATVTNPAVR